MLFREFPRSVYLESSARCNAKCVFCPLFQGSEQMKGAKAFMDNALFEKCIEEIAHWQTLPEIIGVNGRGEPLLDPHFLEKIHILKKHGLSERAVVLTNAQFLSESISEALCEANIRTLRPDLDSAKKESYESIRVGCSFETVFSNIVAFARIRDRHEARTRIQVQHISTKNTGIDDAEELHALLRPWMREDDEIAVIPAMTWATDDLGGRSYIPEKPSQIRSRKTCPHMQNDMSIFTDGSVPACCLDYNFNVCPSFGNVGKMSVLDIWRDEKFTAMRKLVSEHDLSGIPDPCRQCTSIFKPSEDFCIQCSPHIVSRPMEGGIMLTFARKA